MDQRSNKRGGQGGLPTPNHNAQPCNRTGCSGRINRSENSRIGSLGKAKCPDPSTGNEITRKPTGSRSMPTSVKNPYLDSRRKLDVPRRITEGESSMPTLPRSSELGQFNRKNSVKRRSLEGESSSSHRERKTTSASSSISTRRLMSVNTGVRISDRPNGRRNSSSVREPSVAGSGNPDRGLPSGVSGNNGGNNPSTFSSSGPEFTHLMNDDDDDDDEDVFHNMDGITEMLFTLERIEQDLELTHEDLVALETTLFLGGLNLYDQHRDMRLDIDDMSYEELLALEERMGTVSTALPQEALSKCLTRSIYEVDPSKSQIAGPVDDHRDDVKCCICQEEYANGDEIGTLVTCRHGYHATCLNRWLQLKNWCPICKTSSAPSQSPSSF